MKIDFKLQRDSIVILLLAFLLLSGIGMIYFFVKYGGDKCVTCFQEEKDSSGMTLLDSAGKPYDIRIDSSRNGEQLTDSLNENHVRVWVADTSHLKGNKSTYLSDTVIYGKNTDVSITLSRPFQDSDIIKAKAMLDSYEIIKSKP